MMRVRGLLHPFLRFFKNRKILKKVRTFEKDVLLKKSTFLKRRDFEKVDFLKKT